jgi:hypothetical protein
VLLIACKAEQAPLYDTHSGTGGHQDKWCSKKRYSGTLGKRWFDIHCDSSLDKAGRDKIQF